MKGSKTARGAILAGLRPGFHLGRPMRVGLYGGSFNPVHAGHIHVARTALRRLRLDRILWLVSPQNPLKSAGDYASLDSRLAQATGLARGPRVLVTDIEARIGARYSIETITWLRRRFRGVRFVWIIGSDSLATFHRWRDWRGIAQRTAIAVVSRPGETLRGLNSPMTRRFAKRRLAEQAAAGLARRTPPRWTHISAPYHFESSTALRQLAKPPTRTAE